MGAGSAGERGPGRTAALAGLAGAAATTVLAALVHTFVRSLPFLPLVLAQALVVATPGGVATYFIERLGHWALRLAVAGTSLALLGSGALLGLAIPWVRRALRGRAPLAGALSFLPMWAASVALYPPAPGRFSRLPFALVSLPIDLLGGAVGGFAYDRLLAAPREGRTDETRRVLLRALWFGAAGVLLGVADLGRLSGLSPAYFRRAFQRVTGFSPKRYMTRRRLEHARFLLSEYALSNKEIAAACGYRDQFLFSAQFKRHLGVSPAAYRRVQGGSRSDFHMD